MGVDCAIDITAEQRKTILTLLERYLPSVEAWAYGSRAKWTARPESDLDLVVLATPEQKGQVASLREAFEESDLPFRVDLFVWDEVPDSFRDKIEKNHTVLARKLPVRTNTNWLELPFSQAVQINPKVQLDRGKSYPFVEMAAVNAGPRSAIATEEREFKGGGSRFLDGDTLMARITPCLENGKIARYSAAQTSTPAHGSTEFIVIRGRPDVTENGFSYYLTQWELFREYAIGQMTGTSGRQRVPVDSLDHITVPLPPLSEQRAIAHILGTLDDKIELNRRMNETLEEMARALFKSWFVDFDPVRAKIKGRDTGLPRHIADLFPDRFADSELGEIPQGWIVSRIGDEVDAMGGGTPNTKEHAYWTDGTHSWATPKDLSNLSSPVLLETSRKITDAGVKRISSGILPIGTVLLSSRAPIGYLAIAEIPIAVNQGFIAMVCKKKLPNQFILYWCYNNLDYIKGISGGSTFSEISKKIFRPIPVIVPSKDILMSYEDIAETIHDRIVANLKESISLAQIRDFLLPKLISGDIRPNVVERSLEAAL